MRSPSNGAARRVLIVSASVGAGHDGAAHELAARLQDRGVEVTVRDYVDALPRWIGCTLREGYTRTVTHTPWFYDWLYAAMERPGLVQRLGLGVCRLAARRMRRWCAETGAEAVVSTYPLASQTLGQLVARGRLTLPTATFLTDPSVHALWVNRFVDRHLTVLPATAEIARREYGVDAVSVGPLVPAHFATQVPADRRAELLRELGAKPDLPVALVVTGSLGLGDVEATVEAVLATGVATPLVLCGRNEALRRDLSERPGVLALGWRTDMPDLMQAAGVLVHNAGGLSFSESLVAGLPAVTYACIPGHGKANGEVLDRSGVAPLARTVAELRTALLDQTRPAARSALRAAAPSPGRDAGWTVVTDLESPGSPARLRVVGEQRAHRTRARRRNTSVAAAVLVAISSLGMTEGVSAATREGYGVARMPARSAALIVRPTTLQQVARRAPLLAGLDASVLVPDTAGAADLPAARRLSAAGVPLVVAGCGTATLLHRLRARRCGVAATLHRAGVPVAPVLVRTGDVEALDLLVAHRDRSRLVLAEATTGPPAHGPARPSHTHNATDVWVLDTTGGRALDRALATLATRAGTLHLRLLPVTAAQRAG